MVFHKWVPHMPVWLGVQALVSPCFQNLPFKWYFARGCYAHLPSKWEICQLEGRCTWHPLSCSNQQPVSLPSLWDLKDPPVDWLTMSFWLSSCRSFKPRRRGERGQLTVITIGGRTSTHWHWGGDSKIRKILPSPGNWHSYVWPTANSPHSVSCLGAKLDTGWQQTLDEQV